MGHELSEFDIDYVETKSIKEKEITNQLVEVLLQSHQPLNIEFLDESILLLTHQTYTIFFDESFTKQGSVVEILFIMPQRYSLPKAYKMLFPCINNIF